MLKLFSRLAVVIIGVAGLTACSSTGTSTQPQSTLSLSDDKQCPATLSVGSTLSVALPSNPSTGYRWELTSDASPLLKLINAEYYSPAKENIVGAGGTSTWRFQAVAAGEAQLMLVYQRPWSSNDEPVAMFDCHVTVQ